MDDPQSSNPLEAPLDAGSEVVGNAMGALINPFGSGTKSHAEEERSEEQDSTEQFAAATDSSGDGPDEDESSDDDSYYDDDGGGQSVEYTASPSYQVPTERTTKHHRSRLSESRSNRRSTFNTVSKASSPRSSNVSFSDLFRGVGRSILLGLFLYPVIGLGGCVTRLVIQGTPPHPMYQQQAHDQWLNSPVQSWTTEAVIIPLAIIAITFVRGLIRYAGR